MKNLFLFLSFLFITQSIKAQQTIVEQIQPEVEQIIGKSMGGTIGWDRLVYMTDIFGPRITGSENLEDALDWIVDEMKADGFDKVWKQPVKVPHWVRGQESITMNAPVERNLPMLSLGGSIGTPTEGITGEVLVVNTFDELEARSEEAAGKIVLFNAKFTTYGQTVAYRTQGAIAAAKHGAIASMIASVASYSIQSPHTGIMYYEDGVKKIPHAAITVEDALLIERLVDRGETVEVTIKMEAKTLPMATSHNIIAEITGSEYPDELVVLGGHSDSWDVGTGAMDDGGGIIASWEALRVIKELGIKPKRTIRVVLWTSEENGIYGGEEYARWVIEEEKSIDNHILAMESDGGVFDPIGFGFSGSDEAFSILQEISTTLEVIDAAGMRKGGGGADIGPIMRQGVPGMGLNVDGEKYFWFHHSDGDTIDKLNIQDFNECVATMATYAYAVADISERLPR